MQQKLSASTRLITPKQRKDKIAYGFKRKRSVITNATQHRHRRYIFNIDLQDFFPPSNFGRVRGFFIRDKSFELREAVATVIAQIACHDNSLPQGSPCSPVISNLIAHVLDMHMLRLVSAVANWRPELLFVLEQSLALYDIYHQKIAECAQKIEAYLKTMESNENAEPRWTPKSGQ